MLERLASTLATRQRFTQSRPRRAAILLPLIGASNDASLLLTRRSAAMSSHPGQVAFPGGVVDAADDGPISAAMREANEEIGLAPADTTILGALDDLPSLKNDMAVTPVVARLAPHLMSPEHFEASPAEVARIFTIPICELLRDDRWRTKETEWQSRAFTQYYFEHDGETLYGLSAFATLMLLQLMAPESTPHKLPWFKPEGRRRLERSAREPF